MEDPTNSKYMSVSKNVITLIAVIVLFSQLCFASNSGIILDTRKTRALVSDEYTYYGLDFSKFRLINGEKMGQGELIKNTFCPAWIGAYDAKLPENTLRRHLNVTILNDERYPFQTEQFLKNNSSTIVNLSSPAMSMDTLEMIVKDYQLSRKSGIGLSIIISDFNKYNELVTGYVTFFDIESREILYVSISEGNAIGMGMTNHWLAGLVEGWYQFIRLGFEKEKRKAIKAEKKKL